MWGGTLPLTTSHPLKHISISSGHGILLSLLGGWGISRLVHRKDRGHQRIQISYIRWEIFLQKELFSLLASWQMSISVPCLEMGLLDTSSATSFKGHHHLK